MKWADSYVMACGGDGIGDGQLADGAASEGLPLALGREEPQLLLLVLGERGAVTHLVVVRRQLVQQLPDPVLLAHRVHVRHFVFSKYRKVQVHLSNHNYKTKQNN